MVLCYVICKVDVGSEMDRYKVVVLRELDLRGMLPLPPDESRSSREGEEEVEGPHGR